MARGSILSHFFAKNESLQSYKIRIFLYIILLRKILLRFIIQYGDTITFSTRSDI